MRIRFIEKFTLQHVSCASGIINPIAETVEKPFIEEFFLPC